MRRQLQLFGDSPVPEPVPGEAGPSEPDPAQSAPAPAAPTPRPIGRADYAERQEARRERLDAAADRAAAESRRRLGAADQILAVIPPGQPILVGHHSEGRHRRDLERVRINITKGFEAKDAAAALRRAAEVAGSAGISSDDPEALVKLREQLADETRRRDGMKAVNAAYRAGGWKRVSELPGVTAETLADYQRYMASVPGGSAVPFPPYKLSNLGANIRRIQERIQQLEAEAVREDFAPLAGAGWSIHEDRDQNRLVLRFDTKPSPETLDLLSGWHWSRHQRAHLRLSSASSRRAAQHLAECLAKRGSPL